jgi:hypothetical protein
MTQDSTGQGMVSIVTPPALILGRCYAKPSSAWNEVRNESVIEVIVVADGLSEAKTKWILKEAAGAAVVLSLSRTADRALPGTLGSDRTKGEFILPLDSDNRLRDIYLNRGVVSLPKENSTVDGDLLGC